MKLFYSLLIALISVTGLGQSLVSAQVTITEVSSANSFGVDWFELTNFGDSTVNLEGYYWDDNGPDGADGAEFGAFSLNSGQSLIVLEGPIEGADAFRTGFALDASVLILTENDFTGPDTFSGLSGNGDEITIFDTDPNVAGADFNVIDFVEFGLATAGVSFDFASGEPVLSVAGVNGAITANNGDIGSPGVVISAVPEPGSVVLLSVLGALAGIKRRRS